MFFRHLKLEFTLAIPTLDERKIETKILRPPGIILIQQSPFACDINVVSRTTLASRLFL